ncbi:MAG: MFS transporter [Bryobacteraceae bacterium]|jgi:MFS family permease
MVTQQERAAALRFIMCLGIVSLFADMTYEGAASIVGPFLKDLGASGAQVGIIAGFGEMIAASLRYFSGRFVDRTRAYWGMAILGYFMNLVVVPTMAFAGNWQMAALLIVVERTGKSLRGPARDVLLSEATGKIGHGWGFGIHAAMDQTGAVLGPLLMAEAVMRAHHFGPAYLRLAFPAAGALIALLVGRAIYPNAGRTAPKQIEQKSLPKVFWRYTVAAGVLACGFVDFALLSFHFQDAHLARQAVIPLLFSGAMGLNGLSALFLGKLFDRYGIVVLSLGTLISLLALPLGFLGGTAAAIASVACWATGMGAQDACLRSGIAQVVSMNKRGSAFGAFNGVYGIMWFLGSAAMGLLYDHSTVALVIFGMALQFAAAIMFFRLRGPLAAAAKQ